MRAGLIVILVLVAAAVVAALQSFFIVTPTQQALVLQFGEVRQAQREPGLYAKVPFIQDVLFLDRRVLDLNVPAQEIIAADQKRLVVDAFMRYRIVEPVRFYQAVNNVREGASRLNTFVQASLRAVLADATFTSIVRDERPQLMQRIRQDVANRAEAIGVNVVDVRIRRADLPEANSQAIFDRMQTEREQEAREIRAQGQEAARRITAAADRTATVLRAEAERESEQIRGQGDAQKSAIFAEAFSADPQFFAFYRAMQAYEQGLQSNDTRLVLSPDAEFFRFFNDPSGLTRARVGSEPQNGAPLPSPLEQFGTPDDAPQTSGLTPGTGGGSGPQATVGGAPQTDASAVEDVATPEPATEEAAGTDDLSAADTPQDGTPAATPASVERLEALPLAPAGEPAGTDGTAQQPAATQGPSDDRVEADDPAEASTVEAVENADPATSSAADRAANAAASPGASEAAVAVAAPSSPAPSGAGPAAETRGDRVAAEVEETQPGTVTIVLPDDETE